jgi:hypothetical protein
VPFGTGSGVGPGGVGPGGVGPGVTLSTGITLESDTGSTAYIGSPLELAYALLFGSTLLQTPITEQAIIQNIEI